MIQFMKNSQKGFIALPVLIAIIVAILAVGGAYVSVVTLY